MLIDLISDIVKTVFQDNTISSVIKNDTKINIDDYTCPTYKNNAIEGGKQKKTGGHDHRYNTGDDRTPAQKKADQEKRKEV